MTEAHGDDNSQESFSYTNEENDTTSPDEEAVGNNDKKIEEQRFCYQDQDMNTFHLYKPFFIFKKYMEINHSLAISSDGFNSSYLKKGFLSILGHDFLRMPLSGIVSKIFGSCLTYVSFLVFLYFPYLGICSLWTSLILSFDYVLELVNFLLLPYRKEYIFFSYKNMKILYKINYHIGISLLSCNIQKWMKITNPNNICPICLENVVSEGYDHPHGGDESHSMHKDCFKKYKSSRMNKQTGILPCPSCRQEASANGLRPVYKIINLKIIPEIFVELSSNTQRKVGIVGRILVFGGGGNIIIGTPLNNLEAFLEDRIKCSFTPTIEFFGVELGVKLYNTCEIFLFCTPQYLFKPFKNVGYETMKRLCFDIGISLRLLV